MGGNGQDKTYYQQVPVEAPHECKQVPLIMELTRGQGTISANVANLKEQVLVLFDQSGSIKDTLDKDIKKAIAALSIEVKFMKYKFGLIGGAACFVGSILSTLFMWWLKSRLGI